MKRQKQSSKTLRLTALLLALVLMLALTACAAPAGPGGSQAPADASPSASAPLEGAVASPDDAPWKGRENETIQLNAGFLKGMTGIANQFAVENGWYEEAGIELTLIDIPNPVAAFGAGEVDIADGDPGTYVPAIVNEVPMKIIGNMWRNKGAYWIIANTEIESWEDLKGKKVGSAQATGGMKLTLMEVLTQNGIDPENDVELIANNFYQPAYATFTSGEVDATIIHQPFATIAEKDGTGRVLAKTWEYLPDYHTGVLVATQKLIDEQPEAVERVLEVYYYVNEFCKNNFDVFIPWAATYLNMDEATAREAIEAEIVLWENDPIVDTSRLQVTEDLLFKYGMQKESYDVSEGVVDNQFAEKIAQQLKLGQYAE
ncbi:MAG: ABC transporter substrate-binding protein [Christensenellales bacterium]|jgi:NitT/TauT family transport system substrate-binding protein